MRMLSRGKKLGKLSAAPRHARPRTDVGTVILHWLVVGTVTFQLATGLAIAADAAHRAWLQPLRAVLPDGNLWAVHMAAGLMLFALACAYVGYIRSAGLAKRVRPDRVRLLGLKQRGRSRRGAVAVLLYWVAFVALLAQCATGVALYLGYGGSIGTAHFWAAMVLLAFPFLHVLAELAYGGTARVMSILRPARLARSQPPTLAELVARHLEDTDARNHGVRREITLNAHPLAIALSTGILAVGLAAAVDHGARDTLVIPAIGSGEAPRLDGDLADPVWRKARPITVRTNQGVNFGGSGASTVSVRGVHDRIRAYFAFTWEDPTRSLKHLPLVKRADGWHLVHTHYDIEDENSYYEDKFSVMLADSAQVPAAGSAHVGQQPLADKPGGLSGRGLHYTTDGSIVDVWHWKASRGGLLGTMDDNYFGPPETPSPAEVDGRSRYKGGYMTDPGKAPYSNNFDHQPPGGYKQPLKPKRLPKDLAATQAAMGAFDLDPDASNSDGARWWMTAEESVPYSAELDTRIPIGTVIPGVLISGEYSGDRADVRAAARWAAGRWTLEVARRLDTGSPRDVAIGSGVSMWVAAFDHAQTRHTRHLRPIRLELEP